MNITVCNQTLQNHIKMVAPQFYTFMKARKIYRNLVDVLFIDNDGDTEPCVVTTHSTEPPFEYYKWVRRRDTFIPKPISALNINKLIILNRNNINANIK